MADRSDIDFTYSLTDRVFRLSMGELADFSGAKYDGDFSIGLQEAQRRKHEYVAEQIGIVAGARVLDLGCGWGPLLDFIRRRSWSARASAALTRSRASARSSTSARSSSIAPGARRRSTGRSSSGSPRCCPSTGASTCRR
jgi:cyclopropane-fatty-acyl-phospholipid synthase